MSKHQDFEDFKTMMRKLGPQFGTEPNTCSAMAFAFMSGRGHNPHEAMFCAGFVQEMQKANELFEKSQNVN